MTIQKRIHELSPTLMLLCVLLLGNAMASPTSSPGNSSDISTEETPPLTQPPPPSSTSTTTSTTTSSVTQQPLPSSTQSNRSEDLIHDSASTALPPTTTEEPRPSSTPTPVEEFHNLTKEFFEWKVQDNPEFASVIGIFGENAAHLDSLSPKSYEHRRLSNEEFLRKSKLMNTSNFTKEDLLNFRIFQYETETYLRNFKHLKFHAPISFLDGVQLTLQRLLQKHTVLETADDYQNLLFRYREFPRQAKEIITIMKGNIESGLMPSNWSLAGVSEQIGKLLVPYNESIFYEPFLNITIDIAEEEKQTLQRQAPLAVQNMILVFSTLKDFFEARYFPEARSEAGVSSLAGGLEFYEDCLKYQTSTDMTPQQVHDLGLSEVARILEEVSQTAIEIGMPNKTISEITDALSEDPRQKFSNREDLLHTYEDVVYNVLYPLMDQIVDVLPAINITVEPADTGSFASYLDPPMDGSHPGTFFINTAVLESQRYEVTALSLHEAVPGHHLQSVDLILDPTIPDFRKFPDHHRYSDVPSKYPMHIAYSEGWGLYSEYLGSELGVYSDPYQRLGRHSFELLRAGRLVVDTGLHALGWTRQKAIDYLLENTAMAEGAIKRQIDRYITWPAQACSYKIGEIKIRELRKLSEEALAQLFRLQDFHNVVLKCIGPLNILEECVHDYIEERTSASINA